MIDKKAFIDDLLAWYDENKRRLPWRDKNNPYYTWISEIMLQQTQVSTVIPYFNHFISTLPTIEALANVESDKLYKLWEGLGYYRRADNLKKAAIQLMNEFDGKLPESYDDLINLSGVGPYTAGAISSIAFGERKAAIDGNLMRIFSRLFELPFYQNDTKSQKSYEAVIAPFVPTHRPGDFNQAMMDIGATICLPKAVPLCQKCPLSPYCQGLKNDTLALYPKRLPKKEKRLEHRLVIVLIYQDKYLLVKNEQNGILKGLWSFLNYDEASLSLADFLSQVDYERYLPLKNYTHIFTHLKWQIKGYCVILKCLPKDILGQWCTLEEIEEAYSLPTAYKPLLLTLKKDTTTLF